MRSTRSPPSTATVARRRMTAARREPIDVPVLCVGNFTVGGAGKTPVAIALARQARRMKLSPGFLSRGFGGKFPVPHVVDVHHDSARHVGDEPLLLAEHAPVAVTPDRAAGAKLLGVARLRFPDHGRWLPERPHPHGLRAAGGRWPARRRQRPCHSRRPGAGAAGPPDAVRARPSQGGRRRGGQRHHPHGGARRTPGLRGAHRDPRPPAVCRPALSCFRRHRRSRANSSTP